MKTYFCKNTLGYALLIASLVTYAQKRGNTSVSFVKVKIEDTMLEGYKTNFDFGREEVRKGWWKYAKEFSLPLNMKNYYKVIIPSKTTDGNVDLVIFTQTTTKNENVEFFLGLENTTYKEQALSMLLDFKKKFYITNLTQEITEKYREADKLCNQYLNELTEANKKNLLDELVVIQESIHFLLEKIKAIESALERHSNN